MLAHSEHRRRLVQRMGTGRLHIPNHPMVIKICGSVTHFILFYIILRTPQVIVVVEDAKEIVEAVHRRGALSHCKQEK
jgi:hypothetical protein